MEAICSSEMSVATQQTTRRHIPEDDALHYLFACWAEFKKDIRFFVFFTAGILFLWNQLTRQIHRADPFLRNWQSRNCPPFMEYFARTKSKITCNISWHASFLSLTQTKIWRTVPLIQCITSFIPRLGVVTSLSRAMPWPHGTHQSSSTLRTRLYHTLCRQRGGGWVPCKNQKGTVATMPQPTT
jgi:hypothetical protein